MAKSRETLLEELNASVRSSGQGGLTTAQDLRNFLTTLIDEILDRPEPVADADALAYLFQIDLSMSTGEPGPVVGLTLTQARYLAEKFDATVELSFDNPNSGNNMRIAIGYNQETGEFRSDGYSEETGDQLQVFLIGHGPLVNPSSPDKGTGLTVNIAFEAQSEDEQTVVVESKKTGEYKSNKLQNANGVKYFINEEYFELPFKLAAGDKLRVAIARSNRELSASVTLQG